MAKLYDTDELSRAVARLIEFYNTKWPIERQGHCTPRDAYEMLSTPGEN